MSVMANAGTARTSYLTFKFDNAVAELSVSNFTAIRDDYVFLIFNEYIQI